MLRGDLNAPIKPIVKLSPFAGESMTGFLSRSIASTAISDFRSVSRLCGENLRIDRLNCEVPGAGLSALLGSVPEELAKLLEQRFLHPPKDLTGPVEVKMFRRKNSLATKNVRRVAPAALRQENYHRRIWDMPMLTFDLETLTAFVDSCPVCGNALGWRRAVEAVHCDHCAGQDGMPTCNLAALDVVPVITNPGAGLRFASDLANPWNAEAHLRLKCSTPSEWVTANPQTLLEVLLAIARYSGIWNTSKTLDTDAISRAGEIMLGGQRALSAALDKHTMARQDLLLGQHAVWLLETASRRMGITKVAHGRVPEPATTPPIAARRADIAFKLRQEGKLLGGQKAQPRTRMASPADVWDAQSVDRVADILGVTPKDISTLVRWGVIELCSPSALNHLPSRRFISSASVRRLMESIRLRSLSIDCCTLRWTQFISVKAWKDNHPQVSWAEIIVGLQVGTIPTFELHSTEPCWSQRLHVFAANSLRPVASARARTLWIERKQRAKG